MAAVQIMTAAQIWIAARAAKEILPGEGTVRKSPAGEGRTESRMTAAVQKSDPDVGMTTAAVSTARRKAVISA